MDLVVAAGVDEQRCSGLERLARILRGSRHGSELAQGTHGWHGENETVCELVEGALDAEVGVEGEREDDRVRSQIAARVVTDEEHRSRIGDVAEPTDLAPEPDARHQPHQRQPLADEVRVTLVEIGSGNAALRLPGDGAHHPRE